VTTFCGLLNFIFLRNNANICDFLRFQISEKCAILLLSLNVQKPLFQFQWDFAFLTPPPGALPLILSETLAFYKSFTYLLTYLLTYPVKGSAPRPPL